ncbi:hypothetical protein RIF29_33361 [Crotalaria pallida]|uniref:Endonuclease/exonuclease/phosphatase domain-containing protein n=1 Tax=Crotalaria pallida TaxID=3830 RepID=A0AAN9HWS3_CROPI
MSGSKGEEVESLSKCNVVHGEGGTKEVEENKADKAISDSTPTAGPIVQKVVRKDDVMVKASLPLSPSHMSFTVGQNSDKKKTWKRKARVGKSLSITKPSDQQKRKQGDGGVKNYTDDMMDDVEADLISLSANHLSMSLKFLSTNVQFCFTGIYGFPNSTQKQMTRQLIRQLKCVTEGAWLLMGDFNQVLRPEDKQGGNGVDLLEVDELNRCLTDCELQEVSFVGYRYTWSNKRKLPDLVEERLDYALANKNWFELWGDSLVSNLPRYRSDHNPISLDTSKRGGGGFQKNKRPKLYRFEQYWLEEMEECREVVHHSWYFGGSMISKLDNVGKNLQDWSKVRFGSLHKQIKEAREKLLNLQQSNRSPAADREEKELWA